MSVAENIDRWGLVDEDAFREGDKRTEKLRIALLSADTCTCQKLSEAALVGLLAMSKRN